jgi:hypothetical protein
MFIITVLCPSQYRNITLSRHHIVSTYDITLFWHHIISTSHDDITWHHIVSTWHDDITWQHPACPSQYRNITLSRMTTWHDDMTSLFYIFSCWQSHLMSVFKQSFTENIPSFLQLAHFWFGHWQVLDRPNRVACDCVKVKAW